MQITCTDNALATPAGGAAFGASRALAKQSSKFSTKNDIKKKKKKGKWQNSVLDFPRDDL